MNRTAMETVLASGVVMAVPLLLAALGELFAECAGIINIGIEGMMLVGALAGVAGAFYARSPWIGLLSGITAATALAGLFAWLTVNRAADQVVVGTAVNLLALGVTGAVYRGISGHLTVPFMAPGWPDLALPGMSRIPIIGEALFHRNAVAYGAYLLVPVAAMVLFHTRWGLELRAVGEAPAAADTMGISVRGMRWAAVLLGGALAGCGGVFLSVGHVRTFSENMTAGRGFIALAVVIFGSWNPWGICGAALLFGLAQGLSYSFQALNLAVPYQLFLALPYLVTLAALLFRSGHSLGPAALAQPYQRS